MKKKVREKQKQKQKKQNLNIEMDLLKMIEFKTRKSNNRKKKATKLKGKTIFKKKM